MEAVLLKMSFSYPELVRIIPIELIKIIPSKQ